MAYSIILKDISIFSEAVIMNVFGQIGKFIVEHQVAIQWIVIGILILVGIYVFVRVYRAFLRESKSVEDISQTLKSICEKMDENEYEEAKDKHIKPWRSSLRKRERQLEQVEEGVRLLNDRVNQEMDRQATVAENSLGKDDRIDENKATGVITNNKFKPQREYDDFSEGSKYEHRIIDGRGNKTYIILGAEKIEKPVESYNENRDSKVRLESTAVAKSHREYEKQDSECCNDKAPNESQVQNREYETEDLGLVTLHKINTARQMDEEELLRTIAEISGQDRKEQEMEKEETRRFISRDCSVDRFGRKYTEEEIASQLRD